MSGISTSITWVCQPQSAVAIADKINNSGDWSSIEPWNEQRALCVFSRNNHLEYIVRMLFAEFQCGGLSYFRTVEDYEQQGQQGFAAAVTGLALESAHRGLKALFDRMKSEPARCAKLWRGEYSVEEIAIQLFVVQPKTFECAKLLVTKIENDNERFEDALAFLYAHRYAIDLALKERQAVVYAAFPY